MNIRRDAVVALAGLALVGVLACNLPFAGSTTGPETDQAAPETGQTAPETGQAAPETTPRPAQPPPPTPGPPPEGPPAPTDLNVPLRVANTLDRARTAEPVTSGVPLPRDSNITDPQNLSLVDADGNPVPVQFTPLARWGGGPDDPSAPIRWLLLDFQADVEPGQATYYYLQEGQPAQPDTPLSVTDGADTLTVDTGVAQFTIDKTDGSLSAPGLSNPLSGQAQSGGATYTTSDPVTVSVALLGPMRASVHVKGAYTDPGGSTLVSYTARYWFHAGQPLIRLFYTVENNNLCPLAEYEQLDCYHIGDGGGVQIDDLSLLVPAAPGAAPTYQVGIPDGLVEGELSAALTLYQDSSGTDHWDTYPTFTDWDGNPLDTRPRMQTYVTFKGYRVTSGQNELDSGDQAAGWLTVTGEDGPWTVGVRDFWQNFPKALRAQPDGTLEIGLFPGEYGPADYSFTLRAGEHKTHEIVLGPLAWEGGEITPLFAAAPAEWYVNSGALGLTSLPDWTDWPEHEQYIVDQLETSPGHEGWDHVYNNIFDAIERTDFYGIFDYGDWPIDYEGFRVAPLNIKYDYDAGMWLQWARSGDPRWFGLAEASDRHTADIDILHTLRSPRHWGDGITFGHSYHDEDGFSNPHRNEGGANPDVAYGMTGMLLTTYLTGYEKSGESARELADAIEYRLHNDVGLCPAFPDCTGEGWGLMEGLYDAGCRPAANSLVIAVAAYRATADPRYLAVADALVDWARPANQPYINGPTGDEMAVRPWMLNMYLRALADYLEMRDEFGLPDTYDARGSYLAYADWLRTYAWIDLEPIDTGPRAAYPYEWWLDERQGDPNDEWAEGNNVPSVNNWLLLGADAMAYAYYLSGDDDYLDRATVLFRTGTRDPFYEGDPSLYTETKQTINSISYGHLFLYEWARK